LIISRMGKVSSITGIRPGLTEITVMVDGREERAINYDHLTGPVVAGDLVKLNTTAVSMNLGTGGYHFVMAVEGKNGPDPPREGHIMKLRYTPSQVKVHSVEEEDYPGSYNSAQGLEGTPVVVGTLHSMVAPITAAIKHFTGPAAKIVYLMTDGAALPIWLSRLIHELKLKRLVDETVTCGHAFGGDHEAINVYSGLLWARASGADAIVVSMGPGIVGSASQFGHTALEQGEIVNAVNILGGRAIAVPRISFADPRPRHFGLSHHTGTALGRVALTPCVVPIPLMKGRKKTFIYSQMKESGIFGRHKIVEVDSRSYKELLDSYGLAVTTMGRSLGEDPEFFETAWAAGIYAAGLLQPGVDELPDGAKSRVPPEDRKKIGYLSSEKDSVFCTEHSHHTAP